MTIIRHKRSGVASAVPLPGDLVLGELAVNYADGMVYLKKADNTVVPISVQITVNGVSPDGSNNIEIEPADIGDYGVAPLGSNGRIPLIYMDESLLGAVTYKGTWDPTTDTPPLPDPTTSTGWYFVATDDGDIPGTVPPVEVRIGDWVISNGTEWEIINAVDGVQSVAGRTGVVTLSAADIESGVFVASRLGTGSGNLKVLTTDNSGNPEWIDRSAMTADWNTLSNKPAMVNQTVAEAGTSTTEFMWSSQRVRQNVLAAPIVKYYTIANVPSVNVGPIYVIGVGNMEWNGSTYVFRSADKWAVQPIGWYLAASGSSGSEVPPNNIPGIRYVRLTASDSYNAGLLSDQVVSGSGALILATAKIALPESPMFGETIRLINTERRTLRAGLPWTIQESQNLSHGHTGSVASGGAHAHGGVTDAQGAHAHSGTTNDGGWHQHGYTAPTAAAYLAGAVGGILQGGATTGASTDGGGTHAHSFGTNSTGSHAHNLTVYSGGAHTHGVTINANGGDEVRVRNIGMNYYMRIL